jgi:hypothetical protein
VEDQGHTLYPQYQQKERRGLFHRIISGSRIRGIVLLLLVTAGMLGPGIVSFGKNQARLGLASDFSTQLTLETQCYLQEWNDGSLHHTCDNGWKEYYIPDLRINDTIIVHVAFRTPLPTNDSDHLAYFDPFLSLGAVEGRRFPQLSRAHPGSNSFKVEEAGEQDLGFQLRPMTSQSLLEQSAENRSVVVDLYVEVNPRLAGVPLISKLVWIPSAVFGLVLFIVLPRRRMREPPVRDE